MFFGLSLNLYSQSFKIYVNPPDAIITVNGDLEKTPVKVKANESNYFILAHKKGFITKGFLLDNIEESMTIELKKIEKLDKDVKTRKIELSKIINETG